MWFLIIGIGTWLIVAALCFFLSPILGALVLLFALFLTEELLIAYRAEQSSGQDRFPEREQSSQ